MVGYIWLKIMSDLLLKVNSKLTNTWVQTAPEGDKAGNQFLTGTTLTNEPQSKPRNK